MANPLAILSGILGGFGQIPKSLEAMDVNEREQNRLAQQQAQMAQQNQQFTESQARLAEQFGQSHGLQQQTLEETRRHRQVGEAAEAAKRGDLEAARGQVDPRMRPFVGIPGGPELFRTMYPTPKEPEPFTLGPDQQRYGPTGNLIATAPAKPAKPNLSQDVEDILQSNGVDPVRATPAQIQAARAQAIKDRESVASAGVTGRADAQKHLPISREDAAALRVPYGTTQAQAASANRVPLTASQIQRNQALEGSIAVLNKFEQDVDKLFTKFTPGNRHLSAPGAMMDVYLQNKPDAAVFHASSQGVLAQFVRAFGDVGTLTNQDIERAKALLPKIVPVPDTYEVAKGKIKRLRELFQEIAARPPQTGGGAAAPQGGGWKIERVQ